MGKVKWIAIPLALAAALMAFWPRGDERDPDSGGDRAAELLTALRSGVNSATGEPFKLGPGGRLESHSSERVRLLDKLLAADRVAAGEYARELLERGTAPSDPDEWALALRNYAHANPGDDSFDYLRKKVREMLDDERWRAEPSVGFLEAFDVFVYTRDVEAVGLLSELAAQKTDRGLAHAAFLTMDRLVLVEPESMFGALAAQAELRAARPEMLANFFARADLRQPAQRAAVEAYLLDSQRSASELNAFAGVYPNANQMVSNNLLTTVKTAVQGELVAHDRAALEVVRGWLGEERFNPVRQQVQTMFNRLRTFVQQAGG